MINILAGSTSQSIDVFIPSSASTTGAGLTGLVFNTASLAAYYRKGATGSSTAITLATLADAQAAYSSGGFVEVDATNMPGVYRLDLPNAAIDTAGFVHIILRGAANMAPTLIRINCSAVPADVRQFGGTTGTFASGRPEVNASHWAGTAVGSTTVRADLINIAGAAVSTSTAQLGVNVVNWGATAVASANVRSNVVQVAGQTASAAAGVTFPASIGTSTLDASGVWSHATRLLTAGTNIVLAKGVGVTGFTDLDAAGIRTAVGLASANLDTQLAAIDDYIDTEVAAIKAKTDLIPASPAATGDIPAASAIADAVWDEAISGHLTGGSTGNALNAAGSAGDPWTTTLPGSYTGSQAGKILSDVLTDTAAIPSASTIASQVRTELTTELGRIDVALSTLATASALTTVDTVVDSILLQTGTNGVVVASASKSGYSLATAPPTATEIADAVLTRNVSNVEGSAGEHTLCTIVLATLESAVSGSTWTIKGTNGSTTRFTKTVTTDANADPITGVS